MLGRVRGGDVEKRQHKLVNTELPREEMMSVSFGESVFVLPGQDTVWRRGRVVRTLKIWRRISRPSQCSPEMSCSGSRSKRTLNASNQAGNTFPAASLADCGC